MMSAIQSLSKCPWWLWCAVLIMSLFVPMAYVVVVHLWYIVVFETTRDRACEHYSSAKIRYRVLCGSVVVISLLVALFTYLFNDQLLPISAQVFSIVKSSLFFIWLFAEVWQLVILANAYSYAMVGDNFKNSRVRYLLYFIFSPIGTYFVRLENQNENPK